MKPGGLRGVALLVLALLLAGCSMDTTGTAPRNPDQPYSVESPLKRGGTVVFSDYEFPDSFNMISATAETDLRIGGLVFAPLWGLDSSLHPYPDLVREVPTVENGDVKMGADGRSMTVDVKLVPDLRWSDGQPLTADDVIFTWQAICDPASQAATTAGFDHVASMTRKSDSELVWTFAPAAKGRCGTTAPISSGVYASYLQLGPVMWVMPRHRLARISHGDWLSDAFFVKPDVASGPFTVAEIVPDDRITLNANPHYADGRTKANAYTDPASHVRFNHAPYLDQLVFKVYGDKNALLAGLRAGETDIGFHLSPSDAGKLQSLSISSTVTIGSLEGEFLNPNHDVNTATKQPPPWVTPQGQDQPVLEALALTIDKHDLVNRVMNGVARPSDGLYPDALHTYDDRTLPSPSPSLNAAKQILDADGWAPGSDGIRIKNGKRLAFSLVTVCSNPERQKELDYLKKAWAPLGVSVKTDCRKRALFFASFGDGGVNATGAFDMTIYSNAWPPDPSAWSLVGQSSQVPGPQVPLGENWNRCRDPALDRDFAAAGATLVESKRREAYLAAQREWLTYHCTIPLFEWPHIVQISNKLHNFAPNPSISMDIWNADDWWVSQ